MAPEQALTRLLAVDELGSSQVAVVEKTPHDALAVGISAGKPFAVSQPLPPPLRLAWQWAGDRRRMP